MCLPIPANYCHVQIESFTWEQVFSSSFCNIILKNSWGPSIYPSAVTLFVSVHWINENF